MAKRKPIEAIGSPRGLSRSRRSGFGSREEADARPCHRPIRVESIRIVESRGRLGHADPALTLRVYAHAMRGDETDLSFAEFGDGTRRHQTALYGTRLPR
jgi:hypothetical protein